MPASPLRLRPHHPQVLSTEATGTGWLLRLRVPDDLSVPDETDVLRIPDPSPTEPTDDQLPCLESPPDFFSGAEPAEG